MRIWFWHHLDALRTTLARLARTPVVTLLNVSVIGVALALPIPFTNYPFGFLLVVYAVALIERDGIALVIAWVASAVIAVVLLRLSHAVVDAVRNLF